MKNVLLDLLKPDDGYGRLLQVVFGWLKLMRNFSQKELISMIQNGFVPCPLTEKDKGKINETIASLLSREAEVIRRYFGIDQQPKKMSEIAQGYGLSTTRIQQIRDKALRKLRHPSRGNLLREIPLYWKDQERKIDKLQIKLQELEGEIARYKEISPILTSLLSVLEEQQRKKTIEEVEKIAPLLKKSIEELEFSIRTSNCLRDANIKTLADLCSHTENELLMMKNFGRKSLWEIKEKLAELGLSPKKS